MSEDRTEHLVGDASESNNFDSITYPPDDQPDVAVEENVAKKFVTSVLATSYGKVTDYYWNKIELKVGDKCVVEEKDGLDFGSVAISKHISSRCQGGCSKKSTLGSIKRKATPEDINRAKELAGQEKKALAHCREKIVEFALPMSLSRVHFTFDGLKAVFFFTAEARVDFRDLVRDLADYTKVKVEMRQIGVRDEARILGGCGPCGTQLCCSSYLKGFAPVSIRMAKDQGLSLNPAKISGVCGRLMCCLAYEHGHYKELVSKAPKMGKAVRGPDDRIGKVIQLNLLKERVVVCYEDGSKVDFGLTEVTRVHGGVPKQAVKKAPSPPAPAVKERPARKKERFIKDKVATPQEKEEESKRKRRPRRKKRDRSQDNNAAITKENSGNQRSPQNRAEGNKEKDNRSRNTNRASSEKATPQQKPDGDNTPDKNRRPNRRRRNSGMKRRNSSPGGDSES